MTDSLAQALGQNARRLRLEAGATLEQFAATARGYGLPWTSGRVGDFESGRVAPTFPTVYAVALVLRDVTGQPVALSDLLAGDGEVVLTDSLTLPLQSVRAAVRGEPAAGESTGDAPGLHGGMVVQDSDLRLARELGYSVAADGNPWPDTSPGRHRSDASHEPFIAMRDLWGRPFSAERDARAAAENANVQRKGQISRQLKAQLREALEAANADKTRKRSAPEALAITESGVTPVERIIHLTRPDEDPNGAGQQAKTGKGVERGDS